ncbi:hypothetical protein [Roseinatronobacter sp.]|uniref:hypothetical protein n=1 Tax=Roseinatronobacter sp. TaxID=1945755 RepID=UPI0025D7EAB9|nr:hypothetical protein [Rhodobaca sp.]
MEDIVRFILFLAATATTAACVKPDSETIPSRSACEQASHALWVHDSTLESARQGYPHSFTVPLPSKGHARYHCTQKGSQVSCVPEGQHKRTSAEDRRIGQLVSQREAIHERAARACQI